MRAAVTVGVWTIAAALVLAGCAGPAIVRTGAPQQRRVSRVVRLPMADVRARLLERFAQGSATLPEPFRAMSVTELRPPRAGPDWAATFVDPGGYLDEYRRLDASARAGDLLLEDPTGDRYWLSEYGTASGPVRFRCGLVVHFVEAGPAATDVQVFEVVPTIWPGEHWAMAAHGIGFGRYHDIRFVEPTVRERVDLLDLIERLLSERG